ncbi:hypothetical protein HAZT_HAZT011811 [Hyalella azteca]|uniref:C2H2-type domain-containing protein n=1 Tax=Hyalella azteca TaxID=294128 RepID=A0A6A0GYP1_HYAAZ|nr:hypothetical protein HAZT_HAZT011811 [Hyalella azteca]
MSIVVGPGGRINMLTEEQANRLISSGQASVAHMSDDHLSLITGAQESLAGQDEDMSLQEQNMDAVCGDESLGEMTSNVGPEVEMKLSTSAAGDVHNLLEESRGLGCLSSDDDIDINMAMGRDKQMESANEELRVIVHGDEGQNLDCIVDADGNKIDRVTGDVLLGCKDDEGDDDSAEMDTSGMTQDAAIAADGSNSSSKMSNSQHYSCSFCTYTSIYKNNYLRHVAKHNSDQELLHCRRCPFNTIYKHSLKRHMLTHPEEKPEESNANASTTTATATAATDADGGTESTSTSESSLLCDHCPYKTKNPQHFKRHLLRHSNEKTMKTYTCDTCGYASKYKQHYERHLLKHSGKKTYKCTECDYATAYIDNYKRHCMKHSKEKSFSCEQCNYTSAYPDNYKRHMLKHSGEKSYFCPHCNYASAYSDNYERHLLKHANGKIYTCTSCNYRSAYVDNYKRHLLKHTRDKLHTCQYCNYSTVYIDNYRRHVTVHTGEGAQTCPHCNYSTTIKYKYKQHMSLHTGQGLIQCPYCPYKTPRKYQYKRHLSIHTQEGRYNCTICSHSTAYKSSHRKHMLKHGKEPDFAAETSSAETLNEDGGATEHTGITVSIGMHDSTDMNALMEPTTSSSSSSLKSEPSKALNMKSDMKMDVLTSEQMNTSPVTSGVAPLPTRSIRQIKSKRNSLARVCVANTDTVTSLTDCGKKPAESGGNFYNGAVSSDISTSSSSNISLLSGKITEESPAVVTSSGPQTARVAPMTRVSQQQQGQQPLQHQHQQISHIHNQQIQLISPLSAAVQDLTCGGQNLVVNRLGLPSAASDLTRHSSDHQHLASIQNLNAQNLMVASDRGINNLQDMAPLAGHLFCTNTQELSGLTVQDLSTLALQQQAPLGSRHAIAYTVQDMTSTGLNLSSSSTSLTTSRSVATSMTSDGLLPGTMDGVLSSIPSTSSSDTGGTVNLVHHQPVSSADLSTSIQSALHQGLSSGQIIASSGGQSFLLSTPASSQYFTPTPFSGGHPSHITFTAHLPSHIAAQLQSGGLTASSDAGDVGASHLPTSSITQVPQQTITFVQHAVNNAYEHATSNNNAG